MGTTSPFLADFKHFLAPLNVSSFPDDASRKQALEAARSLVYRLEKPMDTMLRVGWNEVAHVTALKIGIGKCTNISKAALLVNYFFGFVVEHSFAINRIAVLYLLFVNFVMDLGRRASFRYPFTMRNSCNFKLLVANVIIHRPRTFQGPDKGRPG